MVIDHVDSATSRCVYSAPALRAAPSASRTCDQNSAAAGERFDQNRAASEENSGPEIFAVFGFCSKRRAEGRP